MTLKTRQRRAAASKQQGTLVTYSAKNARKLRKGSPPQNGVMTNVRSMQAYTTQVPRPLSTRTRMYQNAPKPIGLSRAGVDWLKCAFAAPDFPALTPIGIPDEYTGRTLVKQFRYDANLNLTADVQGNMYILVPPIPGCAYFTPIDTAAIPGSTTVWRSTDYSDKPSLFGTTSSQASDTVTSFRYMSQLVELVPTTNSMKWDGSIEVYKIPLRLSKSRVGIQSILTDSYVINGLQAVTSTSSDRFSTPSNLGVFASATSDSVNFDFEPTIENYPQMPLITTVGADGTFGQFACQGGGSSGGGVSASLAGFGNLDTIVIKLSGVTPVTNSFRIKTWATMEFTVNNNSALYEYSIMSPPHDRVAIQAYHDMVRACPIAVTYFENGKFWDFIVRATKTITAGLSFVPGGVGMIAGGINQLISNM